MWDKKRLQLLEALQQFVDMLQQSGADGQSSIQVAQVMTPRPDCTSPDTNVLELAKLFHRNGYRHQLITDETGRLVGVISDRDVLRCFGPGRRPQEDILERITARDVMSTDLVTVTPDCSLQKGLELLLEFGIGCLPVVADGELAGIVTKTDLQLVLQLLLQTLCVKRPAPSMPPVS